MLLSRADDQRAGAPTAKRLSAKAATVYPTRAVAIRLAARGRISDRNRQLVRASLRCAQRATDIVRLAPTAHHSGRRSRSHLVPTGERGLAVSCGTITTLK